MRTKSESEILKGEDYLEALIVGGSSLFCFVDYLTVLSASQNTRRQVMWLFCCGSDTLGRKHSLLTTSTVLETAWRDGGI